MVPLLVSGSGIFPPFAKPAKFLAKLCGFPDRRFKIPGAKISELINSISGSGGLCKNPGGPILRSVKGLESSVARLPQNDNFLLAAARASGERILGDW